MVRQAHRPGEVLPTRSRVSEVLKCEFQKKAVAFVGGELHCDYEGGVLGGAVQEGREDEYTKIIGRALKSQKN